MLWYILIGVLCLLAGLALGFFIARRYMMTYLKKNPPINEQMLQMMMAQMGMKPSQKKINQMMNAMGKQQEKEAKTKKKKINGIIDAQRRFNDIRLRGGGRQTLAVYSF
ncbi:hypothetical protein PGRAN_02975 [Listeria grandensis FSL F6-0971]|uniref:UPF0154 protein PGRAN_02975 n=3 Tax=Listeria TaxID=1637 RepID=W7BJ73_9LIST|nr:hypothetical protein PGRAN_02975 [Listeria grandensis FSL F6-0971]